MNEFQTQVINYLNSYEVQKNLDKILIKNFEQGQRQIFLKVWQQMKDLEFDITDMYGFLLYLFNDVGKAKKVDDELFEGILIDVYDELQELYEEKRREEAGEVRQERVGEVSYSLLVPTDVGIPTSGSLGETPYIQRGRLPRGAAGMPWGANKEGVLGAASSQTPVGNQGIDVDAASRESKPDLPTIYSRFSNSSFFQNAKQAAEVISQQVAGDLQKLKDLFYQSINAGDKVKVVGCLRVIFSKGVRKFFSQDRRYLDFMQKFLSRNQNTGALEHWSTGAQNENNELSRFITDPANKKYVVLFIRLILEKKLKLGETDSAMVGVGLGSLSRSAGESEYEDMAFGDESLGKFMWGDF